MTWTADSVLEDAKKWGERVHIAHTVAEGLHYGEVGLKAIKEATWFKDLPKLEQAKELFAAGKDAVGKAQESGLGKGMAAAGKVIAIGETLIDYGQGINELTKPGDHTKEAGKHMTDGVVGIAVAGTGIVGTVADKIGTWGLQAYAKHELGRPLTEKEQKDITFKNMASEGMNATLGAAGNWLGDQAYKHMPPEKVEAAIHKVEQGVKDVGHKAVVLGHKAVDEAKAVGHKVVDTVHKVEDKAIETAKAVETKVVDTAKEIKQDAVELKDAAVAKTKEVAGKALDVVVPPDVQAQAKADLKQALDQPGTLNKIEGLGHGVANLAKGLWHGH